MRIMKVILIFFPFRKIMHYVPWLQTVALVIRNF